MKKYSIPAVFVLIDAHWPTPMANAMAGVREPAAMGLARSVMTLCVKRSRSMQVGVGQASVPVDVEMPATKGMP